MCTSVDPWPSPLVVVWVVTRIKPTADNLVRRYHVGRARPESLQALSGRCVNISGCYAAVRARKVTDHGGVGTVGKGDAHRTRLYHRSTILQA